MSSMQYVLANLSLALEAIQATPEINLQFGCDPEAVARGEREPLRGLFRAIRAGFPVREHSSSFCLGTS